MNINFGVETDCIKLSLQGDKHLLKEAEICISTLEVKGTC